MKTGNELYDKKLSTDLKTTTEFVLSSNESLFLDIQEVNLTQMDTLLSNIMFFSCLETIKLSCIDFILI